MKALIRRIRGQKEITASIEEYISHRVGMDEEAIKEVIWRMEIALKVIVRNSKEAKVTVYDVDILDQLEEFRYYDFRDEETYEVLKDIAKYYVEYQQRVA